MDFLEVLVRIALIMGIITVLIIAFIVFKLRYKIAKSNQALVISGGKSKKKGVPPGPAVLVSGGAFITPFKRHEFFSLAVITVVSDDRETQTKTVVPVVVKWTAQLKPDTETEGALAKAVMGFIGKSESDVKESLQQTLEGEVRAVVATLTPEEVIEGREKFKKDIEENVKERMAELGFKLISLNITEVKDNNDHYNNLAAKDREEKRRIAENLRAEEQKSIDETAANTSKVSESARIAKDMTVAEKNRDLKLKQAGFREETDKADKTAEFAGRLEEQDKLKDLAAKEGEVAVEREKQNQRAAGARRDVETTLAETEKQKAIINAEASKKRQEIEADAQAAIAEKRAIGEAEAVRQKARGEAEAAIERARGEADAVKATADAEAEKIRKTRFANAEGIAAEGKAEAEAIRQKGLAEAEAERAKAEALAAQDGVNLQVTLAEIESQTRIKVSTAIATAVAEVGTNATIIDMGSSSSSGEGDLLSRLLGGLPETLAKLDIKNAALNGQPFGGTLNDLMRAVTNKPESYLVPAATGVAVDRILNKSTSAPPDVEEVSAALDDSFFQETILAPEKPAQRRARRTADDADSSSAPAVQPVKVAAVTLDAPAPQEAADTASSWQLPFKGAGAAGTASGIGAVGAGIGTAGIGTVGTAGFGTVGTGARGAGSAGGAGGVAATVRDAWSQDPDWTGEDSVVEANPILTLAETEAVVSIAMENKLDQAETLELAKVYASVKDTGQLLNDEVYQIATHAVDVIKTLHKSGESFDAKSIAKALLELDANASTGDVVKRVAELAKKTQGRRKR